MERYLEKRVPSFDCEEHALRHGDASTSPLNTYSIAPGFLPVDTATPSVRVLASAYG